MRFSLGKYGLKISIVCAVVLTGCVTGYDTAVECYSTSQLRKHSLPSFAIYVMNVKAGSDSRADVYLQMPYRNLRFEKIPEGYRASFSITFLIRNEEKEIVQTKELDRVIIAKTYEESVSSRFDGVLQSFILKPSEYRMEIISIDNLSKLRYRYSKQLEVQRFSDSSVSASTILLLDTVVSDSKGISLRPVFPASLSRLNDSFGIFQELYNLREGNTVKIVESYSRARERRKDESSFMYFNPPYRVQTNGCSEAIDSMYFKTDSTFIVKRDGIQRLIQFYPLPASGYNKIEREIIVLRDSSSDTIRTSSNYFLRDRVVQASLSFQEIVNAMRYILREAEYDSIVIGEDETRNIRINQFWQSHGGFDRRKEFEQKIREANVLFTECANGSETPMGIVFIICGIPDYIECRGGALETWFYTIGERSFPVQFRREKEDVAYYTMLPFSMNDSLWQYFVDRWRRK